MSDTWGTVYQLERDKAIGNDPASLRAELKKAEERAMYWQLIAERKPHWQPIETAPKDGRTVLFRRAPPHSTSMNLTFGFWHVGQNIPGFQSQDGGVIDTRPQAWCEWTHIDFLLPEDTVRWLHPDRIGHGELPK